MSPFLGACAGLTCGPSVAGHLETSLINTAGDQYASMPSLHVAWAAWCALALYPVAATGPCALVVAYPLMTALVVVATGNHFFLDAVAARSWPA